MRRGGWRGDGCSCIVVVLEPLLCLLELLLHTSVQAAHLLEGLVLRQLFGVVVAM